MSDIDTAVVDSLKVLDLKWPIREADFQWSGEKDSIARDGSGFQIDTGGGNFIFGSTSATFEASLKWFGTVRGRLGYAWDNILLFGTGGLAYGRVDVRGSSAINGELFAGTPACVAIGTCPFSASVDFRGSETKVGWALGAGIEAATWAKNWSWKFEYLYIDLGTVSETLPYSGRSVDPTGVVTVTTSGSVTHNTSVTDHILRVGLNYRFY